ncbi:PH domain-containing protein [Hazenella sp. IB182357]|uniref:PH domain-containing protein n=1 Tax=Polycladospora coralii TaxID=2771432 RepID=A0A926NHR5_9BACL|nr:PH domain-containing protein [Polycladospora coralii]MBS7531917.1 PH domain-containing protein [Polycladospora coralii]
MYSQMNMPQKRLSKEAVKVWIISEMIMNLIGFMIIGVLLYLDYFFSWQEWIGWILIAIVVISVLGTVWSFINPLLRYKNWRYDIDEEFLQLKSGVLYEKHELVPMTKIQSVATKQGPILRKYELYSISIETMGSSHTIPVLSKDIAIKLRNQVAHYAKIKEVES